MGNIFNYVMSHSNADSWIMASREWSITGCVYKPGVKARCIEGGKLTTYGFVLTNTENGAVLSPVCTKGVELFQSPLMNTEAQYWKHLYSLAYDMKRSWSSEMEDITPGFLDFLKRLKVFDEASGCKDADSTYATFEKKVADRTIEPKDAKELSLLIQNWLISTDIQDGARLKVSSEPLLNETIEAFLEYLKEQGYAEATVTTYGISLRAFRDWSLANNIVPLDSHAMDAYKHYLEEKDLSASTIRIRMSYLERFLSWKRTVESEP